MQEQGSSYLELSNREVLKLTGIQHVEVFEEEKIILRTAQGSLEIQGAELNIVNLDLDSGTIQIEGAIDAMRYSQERKKRQNKNRAQQSFLQKMFS